MSVHARVAHSITGRLRIQVPRARRNPDLADKIKKSLSSIHGVDQVTVHPTTGSFIVHYHGKRQRDFREAVSDNGKSSGLYELAPPSIGEGGEIMTALQQEAEFLAAHSKLARAMVEDTQELDKALKRATDNNLDLKVLVPLLLAAASITFLGADMATPLWATLGIFSFNSFVALHPPLPYPRTEPQGSGGSDGNKHDGHGAGHV